MKLSLDALKERAEATASMDLLATISGGTDNACHDGAPATPLPTVVAPPAPPTGGTWEGYLNGTLGPNGAWGIGVGIKWTSKK
ncbi:hypothetical protein [Flavobacterium sp.]|jgi:hypothetical protein|uniref:hypothetical protein n=1 Tax=Flavobacterium sp. TaxID=239 RepID=UPI0037BFE36E